MSSRNAKKKEALLGSSCKAKKKKRGVVVMDRRNEVDDLGSRLTLFSFLSFFSS